MSVRAIPLVNFDLYASGEKADRNTFVQNFGNAFRDIGFAGIANHGIPQQLIDDFYAECNKFFALEKHMKSKYEIPKLAGQRGYTSFGKEHAKHSKVADLKEFFQIGREVGDEHSKKEEYPDNITVEELPSFITLGKELYHAFEETGAQLLEAIALYLGLDAAYFEPSIKDGNSILRAIHYPPITQEPDSAIRAEQHEDINLITLLVGASAGGLQVKDINDRWVSVLPTENEIVVNVGDMLQRLTNNYLKSTTHRVVNPPRERWHEPRLSIPFFLHPHSEMDLSCLPHTVTRERPLAYEPITAGMYLDERLREIGLKK